MISESINLYPSQLNKSYNRKRKNMNSSSMVNRDYSSFRLRSNMNLIFITTAAALSWSICAVHGFASLQQNPDFTILSPSLIQVKEQRTFLGVSSKAQYKKGPSRVLLQSLKRIDETHPDKVTQPSPYSSLFGRVVSVVGTVLLVSVLTIGSNGIPAGAENELSAKYGNKGFDTSLVDQTCLINQCSIQAKACLQDDPSCRKGLTCTAKCLGDNACITGCMARYGNENLDSLLKCTIEDNECIKVAILPGGADEFGSEPESPAPVVENFNIQSLTGSWYKVIGYNPNYDCYACQRNTFSSSTEVDAINMDKKGLFSMSSMGKNEDQNLPQLQMEVEFSMPHLLPDGSPPPPQSIRESFVMRNMGDDVEFIESTLQSIGFNGYNTHETMIFDQGYMGSGTIKASSTSSKNEVLVLNQGTSNELSFRRTAHSEGEMFGLKFWENWYIIGENDLNEQEFKFVYYNGKTRQNTYNGAFVYSRTKDLSPATLKKVYQIALNAGMDPSQFCRIRNGCFEDEGVSTPPLPPVLKQQPQPQQSSGFFRGMLASTRISELLGVEPVAARDTIVRNVPTAKILTPEADTTFMETDTVSSSSAQILSKRAWWSEVGEYLENPHRHFQVMEKLRLPMQWPDDVVSEIEAQN